MDKKKRNLLFIIGGSCLVLFIIWAILVSLGVFDEFDNNIASSVNDFRGGNSKTGFFYWINRVLTELGFVYVLIGIFLVGLIVFRIDLKSVIWSFGTGITYCANTLVKIIIRRPRPALEYMMMAESSFSFPSSHTMCSTFAYGFAAYLLINSDLKKPIKILLTTILVAIIPLVACTRVMLGVHYLTDVIGGILYGMVLLCGGILLYEFLKSRGYNCLRNKIDSKLLKK